MASSAVNALNSLLRGTSIEDHEEALKLANAAIQAGGGDDQVATAQHTKVVALLKLDRFDDALRALADGGDAMAARCVLEHAYALYKTGELEAAEALLTAEKLSPSSSRALKHVAAQVAYRAEKFGHVASIYADLSDKRSADEDESSSSSSTGEALDLRINALATAAQLSWQDQAPAALMPFSTGDVGRRQDLEAFETAYNAGSAALAGGDAARATVLLRRAQQLCEASEELSDDDKQAELLPILVQQAYALTRLGRHAEAAALHRALGLSEMDEGATKSVAQTNAVVLDSSSSSSSTDATNPYVVQRQMGGITPAPSTGSDRLFAHQARIVRRNQYAVELQCFKFKGVQTRTAKQLKTTSSGSSSSSSDLDATVVDLGIFHAAAMAEMQTGKEALRQLQPLLESRPDDVGLLLTTLQLHLKQERNPAAAVALLEAFFGRVVGAGNLGLRYAPGLVALAVALYRLQGRHSAVRAELAGAVGHWGRQWKKTEPSSVPSSLMRAAGIELLHSPNPADQQAARDALEQLHAADPTDRVAVAGLVAAAAAYWPPGPRSTTGSDSPRPLSDRHRDLADSLTPVDKLVQGVDVAALLRAGVAVLTPTTTTTTTTTTTAAGKKRARGEEPTAQPTQPAKKAKMPSAAAAATTATTTTTTTTTTTSKLSRQARRLQAKDAEAFDPAKKLDAERWLPLRDRSSYRPPKGKKGGRRRGAEAATMQGGVVREEETLALAGGAGSVKVEKALLGGGGAAKKRKKGKK